MVRKVLRRLGPLTALGLVLALALELHALSARAQMPATVSQTQTTASYKIELDIGPAAMMLTPDQAAGAASGEVMVAMPGMPMPVMNTTDQGQPVNHHLEVHISNLATGAMVTTPPPTVTITDSMGMSRVLSNLMLMYDVQMGPSDTHFGANVYLPDGTYTVEVMEGAETATFAAVMVSGGAGLPSSAMMSGSGMPAMQTGTATACAPYDSTCSYCQNHPTSSICPQPAMSGAMPMTSGAAMAIPTAGTMPMTSGTPAAMGTAMSGMAGMTATPSP